MNDADEVVNKSEKFQAALIFTLQGYTEPVRSAL